MAAQPLSQRAQTLLGDCHSPLRCPARDRVSIGVDGGGECAAKKPPRTVPEARHVPSGFFCRRSGDRFAAFSFFHQGGTFAEPLP